MSTTAITAACNPTPVFYENIVDPQADIYTTFYDSVWWEVPTPQTFRGSYAETYDRNPGYVGDIVFPFLWPVVPARVPVFPTLPELVPAWDPFAVPPARPLPSPAPIPYRAIPQRPYSDPWRAPQESPQRGPRPLRGPRPRPGVFPRPWPRDWHWPRPDRPPVEGPGTHRPKPPGKGEKEHKWNMGRGLAAAWEAATAATEFGDFAEAIWEAIPKESRRDCKTVSCMVKDIYEKGNQIDPGQAVWNVIENAIEDGIIGGIHGGLTPPISGPGGVVLGPFGTGY